MHLLICLREREREREREKNTESTFETKLSKLNLNREEKKLEGKRNRADDRFETVTNNFDSIFTQVQPV